MVKWTRRQLGKAAGAAAVASLADVATGATAAAPAAARQRRSAEPLRFPDGFKWGCATAAFQIEGAVHEDGRGLTNWDVFTHTPGKIAGGANADIACDGYRRYQEDTQLLKALGVQTYRMSIAWSRIFPEGRGPLNRKGLDHYDRVVDDLLAAGITPFVTLFHWDLPQALPGGWQSRDTALAFADYAGTVARHLSDRVEDFFTVNELRCFTDLGYQEGSFAPGLKLDPAGVNQVRHHGILAHGLGAQAVRANARPGTRIGLADNTMFYVPVIDTPEHVEAARRAARDENAMFLTAIMEGRYIDSYLEAAGPNAPQVQAGDMAAIGTPLDFVGLNIYYPNYVRADASAAGYAILPHNEVSPHMGPPWLYVGPEVAYWAVRLVDELWGPKAMYISENGCSAGDTLVNGRVDDPDRIMYLRNYIAQLQRATSEGYPLAGYFLWSLMDNFEWASGHGERFGLHYTDYETQKRIPKLSADWYRDLIARNALV